MVGGKLYQELTALVYGPDYRTMKTMVASKDGQVLSIQARVPPATSSKFSVHPGLLDVAAHGVIFAHKDELGKTHTIFYEAVHGIAIHHQPAPESEVTCQVQKVRPTTRENGGKMKFSYSVTFRDRHGAIFAIIEEMNLTSVQVAADKRARPKSARQVSFAANPLTDAASDRPTAASCTTFVLEDTVMALPDQSKEQARTFVFTDDNVNATQASAAGIHALYFESRSAEDFFATMVCSCFEAATGANASRLTLALQLTPVPCSGLVSIQEEIKKHTSTALAFFKAALKQAKKGIELSLRIITFGCRSSDDPSLLPYSCLAGLAKTARTEFAHSADVCAIDFPSPWASQPKCIASVVHTLAGPACTAMIHVGGTPTSPSFHRRRQALAQVPVNAPQESLLHGTYLVIGGLGHLSMLMIPWLVSRGVERLVLVGRRPLSDSKVSERFAEAQQRSFGRCHYVSGDVSTTGGVETVLQHARAIPSTPLSGVLHCAMVLADKGLLRQDWPHFEIGLNAKIPPALLLHQQTQVDDLQCFVLFSSVTSVFGGIGQANYTAANHFVEQLSALRRKAGLPSIAIQLGPIDASEAVGGLAPSIARVFPPLSGKDLLKALDRAISPSTDLPSVVLLTSLASQQLATVPWARGEFMWSSLGDDSLKVPVEKRSSFKGAAEALRAQNSEHLHVSTTSRDEDASQPDIRAAVTRVTAAATIAVPSIARAASAPPRSTPSPTLSESSHASLAATLAESAYDGPADSLALRAEPPRPLKAIDESILDKPQIIVAAPRHDENEGPDSHATGQPERLAPLHDMVVATVGGLLELPKEDIEEDVDLFDLGMDSLMMLQLAARMETATGHTLPAEQISGISTIKLLSEWYAEAEVNQQLELETTRSTASSRTAVDWSSSLMQTVY